MRRREKTGLVGEIRNHHQHRPNTLQVAAPNDRVRLFPLVGAALDQFAARRFFMAEDILRRVSTKEHLEPRDDLGVFAECFPCLSVLIRRMWRPMLRAPVPHELDFSYELLMLRMESAQLFGAQFRNFIFGVVGLRCRSRGWFRRKVGRSGSGRWHCWSSGEIPNVRPGIVETGGALSAPLRFGRATLCALWNRRGGHDAPSRTSCAVNARMFFAPFLPKYSPTS